MIEAATGVGADCPDVGLVASLVLLEIIAAAYMDLVFLLLVGECCNVTISNCVFCWVVIL